MTYKNGEKYEVEWFDNKLTNKKQIHTILPETFSLSKQRVNVEETLQPIYEQIKDLSSIFVGTRKNTKKQKKSKRRN